MTQLVRLFFVIITLVIFNTVTFAEGDNRNDSESSSDTINIPTERLFFETNDIESSDAVIRDHLVEMFPIISENTINSIILTKSVAANTPPVTDSLLSSASQITYKVSFDVPKNYLQDTVKILWDLNIPSFESKLYQLYNNKNLYIDTWPNVVGTINDKTYPGHFTAYRIRNWPFYKDPDPKKASLPPTKPGPGNPLGLFVVHYDENSLRYFHGTNKNALLQNKMRNLSHGCVRNDNDNIAKMKDFILKRVVKSTDLSSWIGSKKTVIYDFEEIDKFPVLITYKTYDMDQDAAGKFIILYKDIYNYSNPKNINTKWADTTLITLSTKENLFGEYRKKFGNDISDEALNAIIDYLLNNGEEYEKYYVSDLKEKFMIR